MITLTIVAAIFGIAMIVGSIIALLRCENTPGLDFTGNAGI